MIDATDEGSAKDGASAGPSKRLGADDPYPNSPENRKPPVASKEKNHKNVKDLKRRAAELNKDGEWGEQALEVNAAITALDPADVAARTRRAKCLRLAGDSDGALEAYEEALALDPENPNIARVMDEIRLERAEKRREALEREIERLRPTAELENLLSCQQALAFARDLKSRAAGPDPTYTDPGYVIRAYRRALEHDESRLDVAVELAVYVRASGSSARALEVYEEILAKDPDYDPALVGKAAALLDLGRREHLQAALALCERVLGRTLCDPYALKVQTRARALLDSEEESLWSWAEAGGD